jgi:acetylornithine/succinyldiaminopimelate/putrescine aminotransferase
MNRDRIAELRDQMLARLAARTKKSRELLDRARHVLPGGEPSSFQDQPPQPMYVTHGKGSQEWDVDGNQYLDFHNGFGVMVMGRPPVHRRRHLSPPPAGATLRLARPRCGSPRACRAASLQGALCRSGTEATLDCDTAGAAFSTAIASSRSKAHITTTTRDGLRI